MNASHYLEMWSDARAYDGTVTIVQPMIDPLYGGHSAHDVLQSLLDTPDVSAYDAVRDNWKADIEGDFEPAWRKALHEALLRVQHFEPKSVSGKAGASLPASSVVRATGYEVIFRPTQIYDGRYSNVGWLQELPKPMTNLTWDNAPLVRRW